MNFIVDENVPLDQIISETQKSTQNKIDAHFRREKQKYELENRLLGKYLIDGETLYRIIRVNVDVLYVEIVRVEILESGEYGIYTRLVFAKHLFYKILDIWEKRRDLLSEKYMEIQVANIFYKGVCTEPKPVKISMEEIQKVWGVVELADQIERDRKIFKVEIGTRRAR